MGALVSESGTRPMWVEPRGEWQEWWGGNTTDMSALGALHSFGEVGRGPWLLEAQ